MSLKEERSEQWRAWSGDPAPLLDAAERAVQEFETRGWEATRSVHANFEGAKLDHPTSFESFIEAAATNRARHDVFLLVKSGEYHVSILGSRDGLSTTSVGPSAATVKDLHSVIAPMVEKAATDRALVPPRTVKVAAPSPHAERQGFVPWVESHPAVTAAIVGACGVVATVVGLIAK